MIQPKKNNTRPFQLYHKTQMKKRYRYIIGVWRGAKRIKETKTGKFVSIEEVRHYLNTPLQ